MAIYAGILTTTGCSSWRKTFSTASPSKRCETLNLACTLSCWAFAMCAWYVYLEDIVWVQAARARGQIFGLLRCMSHEHHHSTETTEIFSQDITRWRGTSLKPSVQSSGIVHEPYPISTLALLISRVATGNENLDCFPPM